MVPIEDVLLISAKSEISKGIQADVKSQIITIYDDNKNCCESVLSCCRNIRDLCCFCCTKDNQVSSIVRNTTITYQDNDSNRNIDYGEEHLAVPEVKENYCNRFRCCKYSNADTPSNARLLSSEQQAIYYKEKSNPNQELECYLNSDKEFDPKKTLK
ncbi:unnamed protein product [Rotaria sp. Silwood2]|nr:unnamed protein product [Rotaria sp. Silwood2]